MVREASVRRGYRPMDGCEQLVELVGDAQKRTIDSCVARDDVAEGGVSLSSVGWSSMRMSKSSNGVTSRDEGMFDGPTAECRRIRGRSTERVKGE